MSTSEFAVGADGLLLGVTEATFTTKPTFGLKDVGGSIWQLTDRSEWRKVADVSLPVTAVASGPAGASAFTEPPTTQKGPKSNIRFAWKEVAAVVLTSADGTTWSECGPDVFRGARVTDAVRLPDGRTVAVGTGSPSHEGSPLAWVGNLAATE